MSQSSAKNIVLVSLGPIVVSIISFLAEPIISRIWTPEQIGDVSYFNSILMIIAPQIFLLYHIAIVQHETTKERYNLFIISLAIFIFNFILLFFTFGIWKNFFNKEFNLPGYQTLLFISLFFYSIYLLLLFWNTSVKNFIQLPVANIILQGSYTLLLLIFGFKGLANTDNAVLIRTISYILAPLLMIFTFFQKDIRKVFNFKEIGFNDLKKTAVKYKSFPLIEFWRSFFSLFTNNLPILLIMHYWGSEVTGLYAKSFFLLYMIVLMIGDSINKVLHRDFAEAKSSNSVDINSIKSLFHILVRVLLPPFIILIPLGSEIFSFFLGAKWEASGDFASMMSLWIFAMLLATSFQSFYFIYFKQGALLVMAIIVLLIRLFIFVVCGELNFSPHIAILLSCVVGFIVMFVKSYYILNVIGIKMDFFYNSFFKPILVFIPYVLVIVGIKYFTKIDTIALLIYSGILFLPYIYFFYIKNKYIFQLLHILRRPNK